jgi:hypothetical protein
VKEWMAVDREVCAIYSKQARRCVCTITKIICKKKNRCR